VWGDVSRDGQVDLKDLVALGANWNVSETKYEIANDELLGQINDKWRKDVPDAISMLGWDNRTVTAKLDETNFGGGSKDASLPKGLGFGVSFPSGATVEKIGLPVFEIPPDSTVLRNVNFVGLPDGYEDNGQFYNYPLEEARSDLAYIRSYEEEQEFLGVDLSVEARYAMFTGSLKTSAQRDAYREGRAHKLLYKSTKSFGWFYLPEQEKYLTPDFLKDSGLADSPKPGVDPSAIVLSTYGTHYVYAEHRVGQLFIELDFTTSRSRNRNSFEAQVEANLKSPTFALNIKTAIEQIKSNVKDVTDIKMRVHRVGGTPGLKLPDGSDWEERAATLDADSPNLQAEVGALIGAWSSDMDNFSKGAVDDYYLRPISDFFSKTPVLPWEKGKNLRDWYRRWAEFDDLSNSMYGILTSPGNVITNGQFAGNADNWSLGTNWTYQNNALRGTVTSSRVRQPRFAMFTQWTSGAEYDVQLSLREYSQGSLFIGTNTNPQQVEIDTNGTFVFPIIADGHADGLVLTGSAFTGVIDEIRVSLKRDFATPFRHFKIAAPSNGNPVPEQKDSWLQYVSDKRMEVAARKAELLAFGRELYDSGPTDNIIFDSTAEEFELPNFELPIFRIHFDHAESNGNCEAAMPAIFNTSYEGYIEGDPFPDGGDYKWLPPVRVRGTLFPEASCPLDKETAARDFSTTVIGGDRTFEFFLDLHMQGGFCCPAIQDWLNKGYPGLGLAIVDQRTVPQRIVAFGASGPSPDSFPMELFGVEPPAFISSIVKP